MGDDDLAFERIVNLPRRGIGNATCGGSFALGLIEAHSQWFLGPQARDLVAYLLLFALLAARPAWMTRWTTTRSAS